jgi:O-antigen/teichoic acid export membrane protein
MSTAGIRALLPTFLQDRITQVLASPIGGRLARGAFWSLLGTTLSKGCSTISWIIVGRLLGKESFGELSMVQNTVGLFGAAAGMGMGMAAAKYVAEYKKTDPARAGRFIGLASAATWVTSIALAIVLVALAPWLARETLNAPHLAPWLTLSSLLLLFSGIAGAQQGTLTGFESFKAIASINVIVGVTSFPMLLLGAIWGGVTGALWGLIASAVLNCVLNFIHVRKQATAHHVEIRYRGCMSESRVFWDFNAPGMLTTIVSAASVWIVGAIMVKHGDGFGDLGIYNAVQRMKLVPENIAAMLLAPMIPVLSDTLARNDRRAYSKTLIFSYTVSTLAIIPISLLQIAIPWLTLLPYGAEYASGQNVVGWMMVSTITYALIWPIGNILISMGKLWLCLIIALLQESANG